MIVNNIKDMFLGTEIRNTYMEKRHGKFMINMLTLLKIICKLYVILIKLIVELTLEIDVILKFT